MGLVLWIKYMLDVWTFIVVLIVWLNPNCVSEKGLQRIPKVEINKKKNQRIKYSKHRRKKIQYTVKHYFWIETVLNLGKSSPH